MYVVVYLYDLTLKTLPVDLCHSYRSDVFLFLSSFIVCIEEKDKALSFLIVLVTPYRRSPRYYLHHKFLTFSTLQEIFYD